MRTSNTLLGLALTFVALAAAQAGCGGGSPGDTGDGGLLSGDVPSTVPPDASRAPIAPEEFCLARAEALCAAQIRCGNIPSEQASRCRDFFRDRKFDTRTRVPGTAQAHYCNGLLLEALVQEGVATYDSQAAAQCVEAVRTAACDQPLTSPVEPEACERVLTGKRAVGEQCGVDHECATGFCQRSGFCIGVCAETSTYGCAGNKRCAEGMYCDGQGDASACHPKAQEGARCSNTGQCEPGFVCDWYGGHDGGYPTGGQCVREKRLGLGERCLNSTGMNAELACRDGLYCDASGVCAMQIQPGQPCASQQGWWVHGSCQTLTRCIGGTCTLLPGVGEPCADPKCPSPPAVCEANERTICLDNSYCQASSGTCVADDYTCGDAGLCRSGLCSSGMCTDCWGDP